MVLLLRLLCWLCCCCCCCCCRRRGTHLFLCSRTSDSVNILSLDDCRFVACSSSRVSTNLVSTPARHPRAKHGVTRGVNTPPPPHPPPLQPPPPPPPHPPPPTHPPPPRAKHGVTHGVITPRTNHGVTHGVITPGPTTGLHTGSSPPGQPRGYTRTRYKNWSKLPFPVIKLQNISNLPEIYYKQFGAHS